MLARIGLGVVVLLVVLLVVIATRPKTFHIERSAAVRAPADVVFAELNDLHRWGAWNPFERSDPTMRVTHSGAPLGVGASYHYVGEKIGEGRMTIVESTAPSRLGVRADFVKPFAATNAVTFTVAPAGDGVTVTWAMDGDQTFMGKAIDLFVGLDRMVGRDFAKGLGDLKAVAEREARRAPAAAG